MNTKNASLLTTKTQPPPPRKRRITRKRLLERLQTGLSCKLVLLSAPAGYGKTTLLVDWLEQLDLSAAWVSLDELDNDLMRFLGYLFQAVQKADPSLGRGLLKSIQSSRPEASEALLTTLINQVDAWDGELVLILDDYHRIELDAIHRALSFLLDHAPGNLHLVIATRSDPPLGLASLRGAGQLCELRAADLLFDLVDSAAFLQHTMGLSMVEQDEALLHQRTEGWITGLQMAALSLQTSQDPSATIASFSGTQVYIAEYLLQEVLSRQPEAVQVFLLETSVLDRLSAALCNAVSGREDGHAMLKHLHEANLFVELLDHEGVWYRYHGLFAQLLQRRFASTGADAVHEIHRRASLWFEGQGEISSAIEHSRAACDFERVAVLIEAYGKELWRQRGYTALARWTDAMPRNLIRERPMLLIYAARAHSYLGEIKEAQEYLDAVQVAWVDQDASTSEGAAPEHIGGKQAQDRMLGMLDCVRSGLMLQQGAFEAGKDFAQSALQRLEKDAPGWSCAAALQLGEMLTFEGRTLAANEAFSRSVDDARLAGDVHLVLLGLLLIAKNLLLHGELLEAERTCRRGLSIAEENGMDGVPSAGSLWLLMSIVHCERGDLEQALISSEIGDRLFEPVQQIAASAWKTLSQVRIHVAAGSFSTADDLLESIEARIHHQQITFWIGQTIAAWKARIWLLRGKSEPERLDAAMQLLSEYEQAEVASISSYFDAFDRLHWVRVLIARGRGHQRREDLGKALDWLDRIQEHCEEPEWSGKMLEVYILRALTHWAADNDRMAMDALNKALSLGKSKGYVQPFVDEGLPMARLLYQASRQKISPVAAGRILKAFPEDLLGKEEKPQRLEIDGEMIEPLTDREVEVLALIAEGLSYQEVANRLVVSINTIRTHTRKLYAKLGVSNRSQAAARARALGILPSSSSGRS